MEMIFKNDWMQIMIEDGEYLIDYNSGDLINSKQRIHVIKSDAIKAQLSEKDAYEVILKYENQ